MEEKITENKLDMLFEMTPVFPFAAAGSNPKACLFGLEISIASAGEKRRNVKPNHYIGFI